MSRGIDHLVLAVRDLDTACAFYERAGFTLTPKAQHPFGTGNRLAQLGNDFLEVVSVTRPEDIIPFEQGTFSFGAYNQRYLKRCEGLSMIALKSDGWQRDRQIFTDAGFDLPAPFTFSRLARQPDGSDVTVGFDLTFVPDDGLPDAVFFTCDHRHQPQFFYKTEFQKHANTALAIDEVFMVTSDFGETGDFLMRLYGAENVSEQNGELTVSVDQARFSIMAEEGLLARFPGHTLNSLTGNAAFAGYRIRVSELEAARAILSTNGVAYSDKGRSIWVSAFGTVIEFSDQPVVGET